MFHATFKTSFLNYKHRTTDFIAPEANDVKEVIKYLYTDEFRDFSINIFINFLNKDYNSAFLDDYSLCLKNRRINFKHTINHIKRKDVDIKLSRKLNQVLLKILFG